MLAGLPLADPQFWAVTALVVLVVLLAARRIARARRAPSACSSCPKAPVDQPAGASPTWDVSTSAIRCMTARVGTS